MKNKTHNKIDHDWVNEKLQNWVLSVCVRCSRDCCSQMFKLKKVFEKGIGKTTKTFSRQRNVKVKIRTNNSC